MEQEGETATRRTGTLGAVGLKKYAIYEDGRVLATYADLMVALPKSRQLAEVRQATLEIRDDNDLVLAVTLTTRKMDGSQALSRANRHNAQRGLEILRRQKTDNCPATGELHRWCVEPPQHRLLFRCSACDVLGYQIGGTKMVAHKCSTCGGPATIERHRNVPRYRWSCADHV